MDIPNLVRHGLYASYETGMDSPATHMMYEHVKKSPEEISKMIRETWEYIKTDGESNRKIHHILSHFLYLLHSEVKREWIQDISLEIIDYGLKCDNAEVIDNAIDLVDSWHDRDILDLLYNTEIKIDWLNKYKTKVLEQFNYNVWE